MSRDSLMMAYAACGMVCLCGACGPRERPVTTPVADRWESPEPTPTEADRFAEPAPGPAPISATLPAESVAAAAPAPGEIAAGVPSRIGVVTHYYPHVNAGVVYVEVGELRVGDTIHIRGHTTDYYQQVDRLELDH